MKLKPRITMLLLVLLLTSCGTSAPVEDMAAHPPSSESPELFTSSAEDVPLPELDLTLYAEYSSKLLSDGWQKSTKTELDGILPVKLDSLPEPYKYGGIYYKSDPGIPENTMVLQFWCSQTRSWLLHITQEKNTNPDKVGDASFTFKTDEENLYVWDIYPWAANYYSQEIIRDGISVYIYMLVDNKHTINDCAKTIESMEIAGSAIILPASILG